MRIVRKNIKYSHNRLSNLKYNNENLFSMKKKLPKTGIEIKIGAIIYIMLSYPIVCSQFDEKISLLNFKSKDLNELKDEILKLVYEVPDITSKDLQQNMIKKGFTIKIKSFMQHNYPARLNLDLKNINNNKIEKIFDELINLVDIRKISL